MWLSFHKPTRATSLVSMSLKHLVSVHIKLSLNDQTMQPSFAKWNAPLWIRASSDVVISHNNTTNFLYYSFMYTYTL